MNEELVEVVARAIWQPGDSWTENWPKKETKELHRRLARAALAAIEASGTHVVVPVEPTESMVIAGCRHENMGDMAGRYAAMLAARPKVTP